MTSTPQRVPSIPRPPPSPLRAASLASTPTATPSTVTQNSIFATAQAQGPPSNSNHLSHLSHSSSSTTTLSSNAATFNHAKRISSAPNPHSPSSAVAVAGASSSSSTVGGLQPGSAQKTRARDLLRKHYGLGVGPPPPLPAGNNSQDPMDLNSSAFEAKSYYEQLITTSSLPALLKRENELLSEIRQLDSERQSLVYNHHHELIAASDTISAMKTRAESLDGDLDLLRVAFSEISRLTAEVSVVEHPELSGSMNHAERTRTRSATPTTRSSSPTRTISDTNGSDLTDLR